jgi:hypothetical protein
MKQTAEEILKEYVSFEDVNQSEIVELLPLTIVDAMEEYANQCQEDMADKIKEAYEQGLNDGYACMPSTISPLNKQD